MNFKRVREYHKPESSQGPVVYWMSRDQRVHDHWGLILAQKLALEQQQPLCVVFSLVSDFLGATFRQYDFMLKGLEEVEHTLVHFNIPFFILLGPAHKTLPKFLEKNKAGTLVSDFSPLKIHQGWIKELKDKITIPLYQVDSHNIVPCWIASSKQEYAAYTLRPKIHQLLPEFLEEFTPLKIHPFSWMHQVSFIDWPVIFRELKVNRDVAPIDWLTPGEEAAKEVLHDFINNKLSLYDKYRNDPLQNVISNLSPYLHFGQIAPQRVALNVKREMINEESKEAFLEELIVRRELADNFCFYNQNYDNPDGFPQWAKESLKSHLLDPRPYLYTLDDFETCQTHDDLWNACQMDLVIKGKLHGYLRMYWAKKILEWSHSPDEALQRTIYLNDKYFLDGRDPNGYAGMAWSIGGVHDRAWFNRAVFGKVRYMNYNGCKRKFNVSAYIDQTLHQL